MAATIPRASAYDQVEGITEPGSHLAISCFDRHHLQLQAPELLDPGERAAPLACEPDRLSQTAASLHGAPVPC